MHLAEADAQLFLAIVQAFVSALPPSPKREPQSEDWNRTKRHNAISVLRFEVQDLPKVLTKDFAVCDLSDDAFDKASDALEDLLNLLDGLVDDGIPRKEELLTNPPPRFPKLRALETLLRPYSQVPTTDVSINFPCEILVWIKYPVEGAEPLQYRKITNPVKQFNKTMKDIYEVHMVNAELELAQVEATQIFHQSRQSREDTSDDKRAQADLQQAQRLCESTKALAKVFTKAPKPCQPPHSAHIHLSGLEESEIDMLVSVCGETKSKWHIVHWANPSSPSPPDPQQNPTGSICSVLKESRNGKARLRIQLQRDGCWNSRPPGPNDRIMKYAVAPKKTLDEWLCPKKDGEATPIASSRLTRKNKLRLALKIASSLLCFLGSPLLQCPWKSQSILVAEVAHESSDEGLKIKPYISGVLTGCLDEEESKQSRRAKSSILHLGLLLWELFIEEKVTITEEDKEEDEDEDEDEGEDETNSLFNALNRKEICSRESSFIDTFCLDLIANCLNLYGQASVIDAAFRAKVYWGIVKPLITSFEDYTPPKKKLARTMESGPAPLPLHPISSSTGFDQQQALAMKLGIMKKQTRSVLTHGSRWQYGMPSIASPFSAVTAADEYYQGHAESGPQRRDDNISSHLTHEPSKALGSEKPSRPTSSNRNRFDYQQKKPYACPKKYVLFDADDQTYQERTHTDPATEDFVSRMKKFVRDNILPLPGELAGNIKFEPQKRSIHIAVLDTGIHIDEGDELLKGGQKRIILKRNFLSEDEHAYVDSYGHGTHVVRLLLRFAPSAMIIVAKVSESKNLTGGSQIVKALEWVSGPDCNADIIVMSFGLGRTPDLELQSFIRDLVTKDKLIFAAASNGGGNEPRAFPANEAGVFCIHVSDGKGNKVGINPAPVDKDNFSTLGNAIDSKWDGKEVYINGSSFAAPIAAGIAANALEFIRHTLTGQGDRPDYFYRYQGMRALFCCLSDGMDGYDYVKPWKRYLWDDETDPQDTCSALRAIVTYGPEQWIKITSEDSFSGFR
ncbi:hypothetical protein DL768_007665 [Monosporascus sp. mg162]|nr:hypothetical protein DL768_007665 [Monosporascus sp. mg162]